MKFEVFEHTGDVGIRYFGSTIEELFSNAIAGTAYLIGDPGDDCERQQFTISLQWTDYVDLLYQILDKLIYAFEVEEILCDTIVKLDTSSKEKSTIVLEGCRVTDKFSYRYIMKAPTYHKMEINPEEGYGLQIFDI